MTATRTRPDPDVNLPFTNAGTPGHILCLVCMKGGNNWEFGRNWVHQYSELSCPHCGAVEDRSLGSKIWNFMAGVDHAAEDGSDDTR